MLIAISTLTVAVKQAHTTSPNKYSLKPRHRSELAYANLDIYLPLKTLHMDLAKLFALEIFN